MYHHEIFKKTGTAVQREDNCVLVQGMQGKVLLNVSAGIVWDYIDGFSDADCIADNIKRLYGEENSEEHILAVVEEAIDELLRNNLIERMG